MAHNIVVSPAAHLDEYEAYDWYENQRIGLGDELLKELETAYNKIAEHPEYFGFIDERKELRDYLLPRFPFLIVYRIVANTVQIISLHHAKKDPSKKYGAVGL
ncbi:MAG: type II toxin-antitoxin system RelE/ParE family toxin [Ferruginibacter sp.]